jgi:hypothetical protein
MTTSSVSQQFKALAASQIPAATQEFVLRGRTAAELLAEAPEQPDWLIPGVAARGWMVKVAAREKTGKGTLLFHLLGCLERCEPTVFGAAATKPATALIYTEEPVDSVREKVVKSGLQRARIIYGWELTAFPDWKSKADYLAEVVKTEGHAVLFVDNISRASACEDEAGTELARAAEYLGECAAAGWRDGLHRPPPPKGGWQDRRQVARGHGTRGCLRQQR